MNYLENLGFGYPSDEELEALIRMTCHDGVAKFGYYGCPYINLELGAVQLIVRTSFKEDKKAFQVEGLDTHAVGRSVWEFAISDMNVDPRSGDKCTKRVVAHKVSDHTGMAVINLVNADVLPSFLKDDVIKAQMIAFSEEIHYYQDEEAYADSIEETASGKKFLLGEGNVFPCGILSNHSPDNPKKDEDHYSDNFVSIRGTVKSVSLGQMTLGEETVNAFVSVTIDTEFGELEIVHTIDQVEENERANIKVGAVVCGVFVLSGDVAIYEYGEGLVLDEKNDLALVRYVLQAGKSERLRYVLTKDAEYVSDASAAVYRGPDEIIDRLQYVRDANHDTEFFTQMATITSIDDGEVELPYSVGQRCIILSENEIDNYISIVFVNVDESGHIQKIHITEEGRYHFKIDEPPHYDSALENFKFPDNVQGAMLSRAKFHGFIDCECSLEDVSSRLDCIKEYERKAEKIVLEFTPSGEDNDLSNLFGYLFATTVEGTYNSRKGIECSCFNISDVMKEDYHTDSNEPVAHKFVVAHALGKQFFKDFTIQSSLEEDRGRIKEILKDALIFVQQLGELYAEELS